MLEITSKEVESVVMFQSRLGGSAPMLILKVPGSGPAFLMEQLDKANTTIKTIKISFTFVL